jgi:hypothetical protein
VTQRSTEVPDVDGTSGSRQPEALGSQRDPPSLFLRQRTHHRIVVRSARRRRDLRRKRADLDDRAEPIAGNGEQLLNTLDDGRRSVSRRLMEPMSENRRRFIIGGGIAGVVVIAFLAFGVFGVHTLFIDDEVDEANPFAIAETTPIAGSTDDSLEQGTTEQGSVEDGAAEDGAADESEQPESTTSGTPEILTLAAGTFVDGDHPTSGDALVITDGSEQRFLRFEDFVGDNGPDLNVYLRSADDPDDYLDLGDLKGNIGDQNYELPTDVDLSRYNVVDIWCVRFGVSFGTATLSA